MKIAIVGLGLIGGSYAMGLSIKGHIVYGIDQNEEAKLYAQQKGYIQKTDLSVEEILSICDCIILAIYPQSILNFLSIYQKYFHHGQVITDVCGVKGSFIQQATQYAKEAIYLSHHPMAGKEKNGIQYADDKMFKDANFLITPLDFDSPALPVLKQIAMDLEFGNISIVSVEEHDKMIGFTSQLTHAIAVALVNSDSNLNTKKFIGDSYRDLTRIAMINESLWGELFLENKEILLQHIAYFEEELEKIKKSLKENNLEELSSLFKKSTQIRKKMEK